MNAPLLLPDGKIDQFIQRRVCARCYSDLQRDFAPGSMWTVRCPTCGDAWGGATVSRKYAEGLGQQALAEYSELKYSRPDLFPQVKKSAKDAIKDLGF